MSMGLVLLIFDQGPNPGPSSDRYYLFANFASSNFPCTVSSVFYLNLVNQLNFVDEYRSSHLRYTAHETCTHQQKSTVSSCFSDKYLRQTSYITSSQYMIISPCEQRLLCPGLVVHCCVVHQAAGILWTCFRIWKICCPLPGAVRWLPLLCCCCSQHVCT